MLQVSSSHSDCLPSAKLDPSTREAAMTLEQLMYGKRQEGLKQGREEGKASTLRTLAGLVNEHLLTTSDTAKRADMTEEEFTKKAAEYLNKTTA